MVELRCGFCGLAIVDGDTRYFVGGQAYHPDCGVGRRRFKK